MEINSETIKSLSFWLENHFPEYRVLGEPILGTYGFVYLMENGKNTFAVKTLKPSDIASGLKGDDIETMCREFRIWLGLPPYRNVVQAFAAELMSAPLGPDFSQVEIPLLSMARMQGTLEDWISGKLEIDEADKLIALAQAFNGLHCLYQSGIQGHGDLKPSNILYTNLADKLDVSDRMLWPSSKRPWRVCISDLGWADAWVDLGFFNKTWRQYSAPERLQESPAFVPEKSDIFAMGIISAELLLGRYPGNLKRAERSAGQMLLIAQEGRWDLDGIDSKPIRDLIKSCLSFKPDERPTSLECINVICEQLDRHYGQPIAPILAGWREAPTDIQEVEHKTWAASGAAALSAAQALSIYQYFSGRIREIVVVDIQSAEIWVELALGACKAARYLQNEPIEELSVLRLQAREILAGTIGNLDLSDKSQVFVRSDWSGLMQPYERFVNIVDAISQVGELCFAEASEANVYSATVISALAYREASRVRDNLEIRNRYLQLAINFSPNEPVLYYFRVSFAYHEYLINTVIDPAKAGQISSDLLRSWVEDLTAAIRLSPNWTEPQKLLSTVSGILSRR